MSGCVALLLQRLGHAGEPERDQAVVGGMREHRVPFVCICPRVAPCPLRQW